MKRILALILVLACCLSLFACSKQAEGSSNTDDTSQQTENAGTTESGDNASASSDDGEYTIGVVCIDLNLPFYVEMMEAGTVAAEDYNVTTIWKSADGNIDTEISLVDSFIEQGVDCILVDPIDIIALEAPFQRAKDAGIQTVSMGNIVAVDGNVSTIYHDHDNMYDITRLCALMLGEEGNVCVMVGSPGNYVSDQRQSGMEDALSEYPNITYTTVACNYDSATALTKAEEVVAANPDLDALICVTDDCTISAAQALPENTLIFSHDGSVDAINLVSESGSNWMCTNLTGSYRVGYWNVAVGAALCQGQDVPENVFLPTYMVLSDEAMEVVEANADMFAEQNIIPASEALEVSGDYAAEFAPGNPLW